MGDSTIRNPMHQATVNNNPGLGILSLLPPEVRNNIYSRLQGDGYKQSYSMSHHDGSVRFVLFRSSREPAFLRVGQTLRLEVLAAITAGRHCEIRVEDRGFITNFSMHARANAALQPGQDLRSHLSIPTCKRINITIDPPSPRDGHRFYRVRQNVQTLINIINAGARDINPQICAGIDRAHQVSYSYNDFPMFFGPFVDLQARCKAVMVFRATGIQFFHVRVERYCNLIEAAMRGEVDAQNELRSHQLQIDIKWHIMQCPYRPPISPTAPRGTLPTGPRATLLSGRSFESVKAATDALLELYYVQGMPFPDWLSVLERRIFDSDEPRKITTAEQMSMMEGCSSLDMINWAAGLLSLRNPFFDDGPFFSGQSSSSASNQLEKMG